MDFFRLFAGAMLVLGAVQGSAIAGEDTLAQAQLHLRMLGYDAGPLDGSWGGKTSAAFASFYAGRGETFDGEFSSNEVEELYAALSETAENGAAPGATISARSGKTAYEPAFDFLPPEDLSEGLPKVQAITPFDRMGLTLAAAPLGMREKFCNWVSEESFPAPDRMHTYASMKEFNTKAKRTPHPRNKWLDDLRFLMARAAGHLAAFPDDDAVRRQYVQALLDHSAAGSALDSVNLLDRKAARVIVTPDFATGLLSSTGITLNYLLVKPQLGLSVAEESQVEEWLNRLYETYADSYLKLVGEHARQDLRAVEIIARATMASGILNNDAERFNTGARLAATTISFVRDDGSHRFGAARGNRALWYQGASFTTALEDLVLMESQGLPAREILLPTISRMARFLDDAWKDNSVLWPYARENQATTVGSDYRKQDKLSVTEGLDIFFSVSPEDPSVVGLQTVRATYPYRSLYTESFNGTCIGLALQKEPVAGYGEVASLALGAPQTPGSKPVQVKSSSVRVQYQERNFIEFKLSLSGLEVDGTSRSIPAFSVFADFQGGEEQVSNLELLRIVVEAYGFSDTTSRTADYVACGELAAKAQPSGQQVRFHIGREEELNACILSRMGDQDRLVWSSVLDNFEALLMTGPPGEQRTQLSELYDFMVK